MTYSLLRFAHLVGLTFMGASLIGVWISDLRSRKVGDLTIFAEAIRNIAVFYDGVVVPGGNNSLCVRCVDNGGVLGRVGIYAASLAGGMILLFVIEFVEGNTVTRLYFMCLRHLTNEAIAQGAVTPELNRAR